MSCFPRLSAPVLIRRAKQAAQKQKTVKQKGRANYLLALALRSG
jgi:hypothetical protein